MLLFGNNGISAILAEISRIKMVLEHQRTDALYQCYEHWYVRDESRTVCAADGRALQYFYVSPDGAMLEVRPLWGWMGGDGFVFSFQSWRGVVVPDGWDDGTQFMRNKLGIDAQLFRNAVHLDSNRLYGAMVRMDEESLFLVHYKEGWVAPMLETEPPEEEIEDE